MPTNNNRETVAATPPRSAEQFVNAAADLLCAYGPGHFARFNAFPVPVYATDARGTLTYFNPACVEFAGRTPALGVDQWCISWKMIDQAGIQVLHDNCQMAITVREGLAAHGVEAIAGRPDGGRTPFRAFPTPAIDEHGTIIGGVNLLVPLDGAAKTKLIATANKCRKLAKWVSDDQVSLSLAHMASEYENQAAVLRLA